MTAALTLTPRAAVLLDLCEGLGSEDIARNRSIPVETVRRIIRDLREDGVLAQVDWHGRGVA